VLFIIVLTFMAISFVIDMGTPSTGLLEKAVLLGLIGGCVYGAAKVTTLSERLVPPRTLTSAYRRLPLCRR
jgi:hypothetical protein